MVNEVSFHLDRGEVLSLVGESGSGKSITALSILNLVPRPGMIERGEALYKGKDLFSLKESEIRRIRGKEISMVFQDPNTSLNPVLKIDTQLREVFEAHGEEVDEEKIISVMEEMGFKEPKRVLDSYPHELSGGMKQRVAIAMALLGNPKILIADEPTTALDVSIQAQILSLFKKERETRGISIIFITHDFGVVAEIADRVCVMLKGYIVEEGNVFDIFDDPLHPYTRHLISSIPGKGLERRTVRREKGRCPFYHRCPEGMTICREKMPKMVEEDGRRVRCWRPQL